jgi:phage shock protein PspC (stress-responsive transcriptional regulator)
MLEPMTTMTDSPSPAQPPTSPGHRALRRSSDDRVAAGVAGGLGEYFGLDPVLFRVLFAVSSFFGGVGILAYIVGWAVIPERGTTRAPLDRLVAWFRSHNIPLWLAGAVAVIVVWTGLFSWWAPGQAAPAVLAIVILAVVFARRSKNASADRPKMSAPPADSAVPDAPLALDSTTEPWLPETRSWIAEARTAGQARRRRVRPIFWATLGVLVATLGGLAIADAVGGILLAAYFWTGGAIALAGLVLGLALRRPAWSLSLLLLPAAVGLVAFGGSGTSLHDGVGRNSWTPPNAASLQDNYRLAIGQAILDLRKLPMLDTPRTVDITMGAGQVRILVPAAMNVMVNAHVHVGTVQIDDDTRAQEDTDKVNGANINHVIDPPAGATGALLTINVHLADGDVSLEHS